MKKLTDVYIKASTRNKEALSELLNMPHLRAGLYVVFGADSIENANIWETLPKHKQNVTLRDLKRLVESIPTREEIRLLKGQNRALKLNYNKAKDVMEELSLSLNVLKNRNNSLEYEILGKKSEIKLIRKQLRALFFWCVLLLSAFILALFL